MKELLKKIKNKEEFFQKLLKFIKKQDIDYKLKKNELELTVGKSKYKYQYFHNYQTQTIIIDGIFNNDAGASVLVAEFIAQAIYNKHELNSCDIINMMFICSYIDNYNYLNLRLFKVNSFNPKTKKFSEVKFPIIHQLSKSQVANIIQGTSND